MSDLKQLLGSPITYHPVVAEVTGSINAAILLSQLMYWWERKSNGLLYKTIQEIKQETCMTKNQQITAIRILEDLDFIQVFVVGLPPKRNFAIKFENIKSAINRKSKNQNINLHENGKTISCKVENINSEKQKDYLLKSGKLKSGKVEKLISENRKNYTENTTKITAENTTKTTTENIAKITFNTCSEEKSLQKINKILLKNEIKKDSKIKKKKNNPPELRVAPLDESCLKKDSLHQKMKEIFIDVYKAKVGLSFYWTGKEGKHLSELIVKLKFMFEEMKKIPDDDSLAENFRLMLENIQDKWILNNFTIPIINSKFNEIILKIKNGNYNRYSNEKQLFSDPNYARELEQRLHGCSV